MPIVLSKIFYSLQINVFGFYRFKISISFWNSTEYISLKLMNYMKIQHLFYVESKKEKKK